MVAGGTGKEAVSFCSCGHNRSSSVFPFLSEYVDDLPHDTEDRCS